MPTKNNRGYATGMTGPKGKSASFAKKRVGKDKSGAANTKGAKAAIASVTRVGKRRGY